ncbi:MAG TPA: cellulase family glycosylhydrolase [Candidatus Acidoferrales bacterium]|nr:cellulase family glycosylhydrolase [Candidatus Acidoferrales bacterium]
MLGILGLAMASAPLTAVPVSAQDVLAVRVSGNQLVDGRGTRLVLHGYDISATEFACDQGNSAPYGWSIFGGPNDSAAVMTAMAAWKGNVVRVPLNEDCWLGINGVKPAFGGATYRSQIVGYVQALHQHGFYVVLDLHWSAPGSAPAQAQQPMPDLDHSPAFWYSVASTFKSDPAVLFDLYNEPYVYGSFLQRATQNSWACWLDGCAFTKFVSGKGGAAFTTTYNWTAVGMQQLVDKIRSSGATQPIMVGGLDWANDLSGWLAHRPRDPDHQLVASWHSYPGQGCSVQTCWDQVIVPIASSVPVVVGETGDRVCKAAAFDPVFLPWADAHGISYLGWTWNPWSNCSDVLVKDWKGTPTSNYGEYFHGHLQALASGAIVPGQVASSPQASAPPPTLTVAPHLPASRTPVAAGALVLLGLLALIALWGLRLHRRRH